MKQFYIAEIVTKDKLVHQGIFFQPSNKNKKAILWVHGLTDNFYGDLKLMEELSVYCEKEGWGLASFNNRGHDIVSTIAKVDKRKPKGRTAVMGGSAYEDFKGCVQDIDAAITFLVEQGFLEVAVIGISTGANKVCFYAGTRKDHRVVAVVLASAISDVAIKLKELKGTYKTVLEKVKKLTYSKAENLVEGIDYMPLTPKRFLSLYEMNSEEDVFPYYQKSPAFSVFSKIRKSLMVIMAGRDEYADRPIRKIKKFFDTHQHSFHYQSVVIPGAFHSYGGKEKKFVDAIASWISALPKH